MKAYQIILDGNKVNSGYIRGRISGMIHVLTGQPKMSYGWAKPIGEKNWMTGAMATEDQIAAITDCIEMAYPYAILSVKEKE